MMMEKSFDLGEYDFLSPSEMMPDDSPTQTFQVVISQTVMAAPFGGSRPMTGEEYDVLSRLADSYALKKSPIPGIPGML
ncbi:MAG: hypothetical protein NVS3B25_21310 [Hymenobacter sp.]